MRGTIGAMAREEAGPETQARARFFDRVDRPQPAFVLGNQEDPDDRSHLGEKPCPICGHPMFEHRVDESTSNVLVECPTDERLPERDAAVR